MIKLLVEYLENNKNGFKNVEINYHDIQIKGTAINVRFNAFDGNSTNEYTRVFTMFDLIVYLNKQNKKIKKKLKRILENK